MTQSSSFPNFFSLSVLFLVAQQPGGHFGLHLQHPVPHQVWPFCLPAIPHPPSHSLVPTCQYPVPAALLKQPPNWFWVSLVTAHPSPVFSLLLNTIITFPCLRNFSGSSLPIRLSKCQGSLGSNPRRMALSCPRTLAQLCVSPPVLLVWARH